ncbi:MAG: alpha/beta hydrolase [Sphingobacteriales bacterium]|nr:alpha/beta hydrolase [Sphingobacteriales bacterium]
MKIPCLFLFLLPGFFGAAQSIQTDTVYSAQVKDKFIITIRKPAGFTTEKKYHHVYMTDGSLGIGDYVFGRDKSWAAAIPSSCIIIAISHTGDWHEKRSRDFIPADISKNTEANFGKADLFYGFLRYELIPRTEKKLPNKKDRVFIGHSFGGLFCLYTLFKDDKLFDRHFAISPSVWANYHELDKIEEGYFKSHKALKADVTIFVGGLEFLNKVLFSTRSFYTTVTGRQYKGLRVRKEEIGNANHFSIRKPAIDRVFESLKD